MSDNQNPQEISEDVEAHGTLRGSFLEDTEDTEGHAVRIKGLTDDDDDETEGHGVRVKI